MKKKVPVTQSCPLEYYCNQPNTDKLLLTDVPKNLLILINHTLVQRFSSALFNSQNCKHFDLNS